MAPDLLKDLDGLETNRAQPARRAPDPADDARRRHLRVRRLRSRPWPGTDTPVPPRAQAAHQQATHLAKQLRRRLAGMPVKDWHYRDFGSLVSLGQYTTVGNLMGKLVGGNLFIEGLIARPHVPSPSTRCTSTPCTAAPRSPSIRWRASSPAAPSPWSSCIDWPMGIDGVRPCGSDPRAVAIERRVQ